MHCLICHYTSVILSTTIVHCVSAHCKLAIICKDNDDVQNCTCYDTFLVRRNLPTLIMRELTTNVYSGLSHNLKPFRTFLLLLGARQKKSIKEDIICFWLGYKYLLRPRSSQSTKYKYLYLKCNFPILPPATKLWMVLGCQHAIQDLQPSRLESYRIM